MEKIIYAVWRREGEDRSGFQVNLRNHLATQLAKVSAQSVRLNLPDAAVEAGHALAQTRYSPHPDAIAQFWLPSSNAIFRQEIDDIFSALTGKFCGWLVAESQIIRNTTQIPAAGTRTPGFAQLAFLTKPSHLSWQAWRTIWRDSHTRIAIDTQSNFEYIQNLIVEPLHEGAPPYVAIVEECFPTVALTDPFAFFDAVGDKAKFERNLAAMMESCDRFITRGEIDVFPTSQHDFPARTEN